MKIILASAAIALTMSANSALAEGDEMSWTGFYAGVNVGYVGAKTEVNGFLGGANPGYWDTSDKLNASGVIGGVQAGYNWQSSAFVMGLEADIQATSANKSSVNSPLLFNGAPIAGSSRSQKSELKALGTVRARVGMAVERAFIYATGGLAVGHVKDTMNWTGGGGNFNASNSIWKAGWTAGAGIEYPINDYWTFKGEYLYYDLGGHSTIGTDPTLPQFFVDNSWRNKGHIVRGGFNYRFGNM